MNSKEYFENQIENIDKSTIIPPNLNNDKEKGNITKIKFEIKKTEINKFCKIKFIPANALFLSSTILALNNLNDCDETLIYYEDNIPFVSKIKSKDITIKDFLNNTKSQINENEEYKNYPINSLLNEHDLKPEFYYSFNESLKNPSEITYSNYLNINDDYENIIISFFYNDALYTEEYIKIFLKNIGKIINQIITCKIDEMNIGGIEIDKNMINE